MAGFGGKTRSVFSPLTDSVCFSGCETKPLPYYATSLKIETLLCPVSLISFYKGSTFVPQRWLRSAVLRSLDAGATPHSRARYHFHYQVKGVWMQLPAKYMFSLQIQLVATLFLLWECRCTTCPFPRYSRPRLGQLR